MSIIAFISFVVLFILLISLFKSKADIFSPARLFLIIWTGSIGLTELKFSGLQREWTIYSWIIVTVSLLSFLIGIFSVYAQNFDQKTHTVLQIRDIIINQKIKSDTLLKIIYVLFFIYLLSYLAIYLVVGFIPLFSARPDLTRTKFSLFGLGILIHSVPTIVYLIIIYYLKVKKNSFNKFVLLLILLISFISYLFLLQRFDLVIILVLSTVLLYYGSFKLKSSYSIIIVSILIIVIFGISNLRSGSLFIDLLYYGGQMKFSKSFAIFTEPYMYITMNLENFAFSAEKLTDYTFGYYSFDFFLALTGLKHWIAEYSNLNPLPYLVNSGYNTYTMFFVYYRDFGIFGSLFFPLILGISSYVLYLRILFKPNINSVSLYGLVTFVIIFSFFVPMLNWLNFVYNISLIHFLTKKIIL